jgi:c-di-GMP-binding flagellar brake protein YcgR
MVEHERRRCTRIHALNLISYSCFDDTENIVAQGMGRTLNVSEDGILLETSVSIDPKYSIALSIGLENELINIKGKIIHSESGKNNKFEAGIEFLEIDESTVEILRKYIKAFSEQ